MARTVHDRERAAEVWAQARAGAREVREELCGLAHETALAELRRRGVGGHDAQELAQETVASFLRYLGDRTEPPRDIPAFLKYRALGVLGDWRKRMRVRGITSEPDERALGAAQPDPGLERADLRDALEACLERLNDSLREVVRERYAEQGTSRAIAARLGIDKSTVNVRTFRALRALRECLTRRGFGTEDLP